MKKSILVFFISALAFGCSNDGDGDRSPSSVVETGFLSCMTSSATCDGLECIDKSGESTCMDLPAACANTQTPTCECLSSLCEQGASCTDTTDGIECTPASGNEDCATADDSDACCKTQNDAMWFFHDGGCHEASGCAAESCCVPGPKGDSWCQANFGDCNSCTVTGGANPDGSCSQDTCSEPPTDCATADDPDACCKTQNDAMWFFHDGGCHEASGCEAESCCVPGPKGDSYCSSTYGSCNTCEISGGDNPDGGCTKKTCPQ